MNRALAHLRSNAIAYAALFVALGGTSYAALNLPANSVGTRQLKAGAVTPAKLDHKLIGGSVRAWAYVNAAGHEVAGSGIRDVRRQEATPTNPALFTMGVVNQHVNGCAATASVAGNPRAADSYAPGSAIAFVVIPANRHFPRGVSVETYDPTGLGSPLPFLVEVLC